MLKLLAYLQLLKNPKQLSNEFKMDLVEYDQRPVPLERHLVFVKSDIEKRNLIRKLIIKEFNHNSSKGFFLVKLLFSQILEEKLIKFLII